ncbi:glycoside hydrolase family 28 protein [Geopyxis carbonaria]|nr:glycoside hydrolase family 28 protein [Geopyxis carbonaria]
MRPLQFLLPFAGLAAAWKHCTVPAPREGVTDSSPAIHDTFKRCSRDARVTFSANTVYPIGSVVSLQNLKNVHIDLRGTLQYSDNLRYWIQHSLYQPFQNASIGLEIGGTNLTIDGHGTGVVDGNGQVWYDYTNGFSQYFGRPIPFSLRRAHNATATGFRILNSQYWSFLISNSSHVDISHITINNTSITQPDAYPGNLGNTDGFDTLYSDHVTIRDSYARVGDDCIAVKPNSTNIVIANMTCERGSGITIGSLGQYAGVYDLVENVTVANATFLHTTHSAWMKTWSGAVSPWVYPPNGGGGGTGRIRNVLYKDLRAVNVSEPVYITMCNSYSQYAVPCEDAPSAFEIEGVVWDGVTVEGGNGTVVGLRCLGQTGCNGVEVRGLKGVGREVGEESWVCRGVNGVDEGCSEL